LTKLVDGLSAPFASARDFVDFVHEDRQPSTTRALAEWENQFGLVASASDVDRRAALASAWSATGGQSPRYLQDVVRAAGFDVYIHEWWVPPNVAPRTARNPRDYTSDPLVGTVQCGEAVAQCGEPNAQCNAFLANDIGYIVNLDLTGNAPPPVPNNTALWPFFIYWGAATFGVAADVPAARRDEFERLLRRLCPAHCWIVTIVTYV
jgi:hypothetical protein